MDCEGVNSITELWNVVSSCCWFNPVIPKPSENSKRIVGFFWSMTLLDGFRDRIPSNSPAERHQNHWDRQQRRLRAFHGLHGCVCLQMHREKHGNHRWFGPLDQFDHGFSEKQKMDEYGWSMKDRCFMPGDSLLRGPIIFFCPFLTSQPSEPGTEDATSNAYAMESIQRKSHMYNTCIQTKNNGMSIHGAYRWYMFVHICISHIITFEYILCSLVTSNPYRIYIRSLYLAYSYRSCYTCKIHGFDWILSLLTGIWWVYRIPNFYTLLLSTCSYPHIKLWFSHNILITFPSYPHIIYTVLQIYLSHSKK